MHAALGAKIVPFAGFEMPVQYPTGITAEHKAVREKAGLFDVSHMGEFVVRGPQAVEFVNHVTTNDVNALKPGQAQYSTILREDGTIVDDCLVYRADDRVLMVVNGSNIDKDFAHISRFVKDFDVTLDDISDKVALLALQGPDAARILQQHTDTNLSGIKYYEFTPGTVAGVEKVYISRTGYTGEDGFELYFPAEHAEKLWNALTASGEVVPAGLGARDSLRLEMGMALYGNDLDDTTTPLEAIARLARQNEERRFRRTRCAGEAEGRRRQAKARRIHDDRALIPAARLSGIRQGEAERRSEKRNHESDARNPDRYRVRPAGLGGGRIAARDRDPRQAHRCDSAEDAVLQRRQQAVAIFLCACRSSQSRIPSRAASATTPPAS